MSNDAGAVLTTVHSESERHKAQCAEDPGWEKAVGERHRAAHADLMQRHAVRRAVTSARAGTAGCVCPRRVNPGSGRPRAQASRSSAASGDSGDDDGEPAEPAPARGLDPRRTIPLFPRCQW